MEMHKVSLHDLNNGQFPFTHDCVLVVWYIKSSPIRFEIFTIRSQDSGKIADIICNLSGVRKVNFSSIDEFNGIY